MRSMSPVGHDTNAPSLTVFHVMKLRADPEEKYLIANRHHTAYDLINQNRGLKCKPLRW